MLDILRKLFFEPCPVSSKDIAKERLRLVLLHDRASVSGQYMGLLKDDMIKAVSTYMEVNEQDMQVNLNCEDQTVTLVANIPVSAVKRPPASRQAAEDVQSAALTTDLSEPSLPDVADVTEEETFTVHGI